MQKFVLLSGKSGGYADDLARTAIWRGDDKGPLICEVQLKTDLSDVALCGVGKLKTENR